MLGAFILWFGWYGFNTGSAISITGPDQNKIISIAAVNTTLAAASSCFSALATNYIIAERRTGEGEFSLKAAMNGCLSGLVAITGGCAGKTVSNLFPLFVIRHNVTHLILLRVRYST